MKKISISISFLLYIVTKIKNSISFQLFKFTHLYNLNCEKNILVHKKWGKKKHN